MGPIGHAQRTREVGVRKALGADPDLAGLAPRNAAALAVAGIAAGSAASASTRLLAALLYDASTTDPVIFLAVPLLLALAR